MTFTFTLWRLYVIEIFDDIMSEYVFCALVELALDDFV